MTNCVRIVIVLAVAFLFIGVAVLQQADAAGPSEVMSQETPAETSPPAETTPPNAGADETPWWVLLIVLFGLFVLIIALLIGARRRKPAASTVPPGWKAHAQNGYAEARWLSDNMTESLAIWRGDAEFDGDDASGATDASRVRVWDQLTPRLERATSELYALEAAAGPNSPALRASQSTISALNETYGAMAERSDARAAYRTVTGAEEPAEAIELTSARDREARASAALAAAHKRLTGALNDLSAIG